MIAAATHRHGWRTGTAWIASGPGAVSALMTGYRSAAPGDLVQPDQYDGTHDAPPEVFTLRATPLLAMAPSATFHAFRIWA